MAISDLPEAFGGSFGAAEGATEALIPAATARGNTLLCSPDAWFFDNNVMVHEFAHVMHLGFFRYQRSLQDEIEAAYREARDAGRWSNTYAGTNSLEYFAELTQKWFEVGRRRGPVGGDGFANEVIARDELLEYDPRGHALVASLFGSRFDVPGCVQRNRFEPFLDPELSEFTHEASDDIGERVERGCSSARGFATPKAWQIQCDDFANFAKRIHREYPLRQV
jgi:hypothetical protein